MLLKIVRLAVNLCNIGGTNTSASLRMVYVYLILPTRIDHNYHDITKIFVHTYMYACRCVHEKSHVFTWHAIAEIVVHNNIVMKFLPQSYEAVWQLYNLCVTQSMP